MPYGLRGYGFSRGFGDFVPTLCDPMDVACVEKNAAASVAYQQQQQESQAGNFHDDCIANGTDPAVCDARWPSGYAGNVPFLNLTPQQQADQMATPTQAAYQMLQTPNVAQELHQFGLNPLQLLPSGYNVVDEYGPVPTTRYVTSPPAPSPPVPAPKASTPAPGAAPAAKNSDGSPVLTPALTLPTVGGFDLSTVPWWGWAGAAAVALFAFGGKR